MSPSQRDVLRDNPNAQPRARQYPAAAAAVYVSAAASSSDLALFYPPTSKSAAEKEQAALLQRNGSHANQDILSMKDPASRSDFMQMPLFIPKELVATSAMTDQITGKISVRVGTPLIKKHRDCEWQYVIRGNDFSTEFLIKIPESAVKGFQKDAGSSRVGERIRDHLFASRLVKAINWAKAQGIRKEMVTVQRIFNYKSRDNHFLGADLDPDYTETCIVVDYAGTLAFVPIPLEHAKHIRKTTNNLSWGVSPGKVGEIQALKAARKLKNMMISPQNANEFSCMIPMSLYNSLDTEPVIEETAGTKRKAQSEPQDSGKLSKKQLTAADLSAPESFLFGEGKAMVEKTLDMLRKSTNNKPIGDSFRLFRKGLLQPYDVKKRDECGRILQQKMQDKKKHMTTSNPNQDGDFVMFFASRVFLATHPVAKEYLDSVEKTL